MSTYTSNYAWEKPAYGDDVDIMVLNNNLDDQDSIVHNAYMQFAPVFSASSTYAVDDVVLYSNNLYKCHTAVTTAGAWTGSANWTQVKVSDICGSGSGGTSNYNQLTNKPQINSVELSGNKTAAQLGLMASDGVVANPTGQTTGSLTALEVDGTKYAVGGSGTSDYTDLTNKPSINGVTLSGNKTTSNLGISYNDLTNKPTIPTDASDLDYDNTDSGLTATDVQGAVDEVEERFNYSTTEHIVGKWIDGSDLYEKVINFGGLPNATTKSVSHGISNLGVVVEISGFARNTSTNTFLPLATATNNYVAPFVDNNNVGVTTGADRSAYDECYFILRYTKNS